MDRHPPPPTSRTPSRVTSWSLGIVGAFWGFLLLCIGWCIGVPCLSTGLQYGMWTDRCPVGDLRVGAEVKVPGLLRGEEGVVRVRPYGRFLEGEGPDVEPNTATLYRGFDLELTLLDDEGAPLEGFEVLEWAQEDPWQEATVRLPELPDGDYTLRATLSGPETIEVDVALELYAPALVHLMSDRPLYQPGQEVLLRAAMLDRTDLSPLTKRTGYWVIEDPDGTEMLKERDRAGPHAVADTHFPLDSQAPRGTWTARWESGEASDEVAFEVRPFQLPRFTVELESAERWFGAGDPVRVDGTARYSSGAPVAEAPVEVELRVIEGRWPLPIDWEDPIETRTDARGRFQAAWGAVPADLIERNVVQARATVVESAGETAVGAVDLVLSEDDLKVESVSELDDGLVGGFNNRVYLRVLTPDGQPLPDAELTVSQVGDTRASPREATADADGVAALQLDPGDPATVVLPEVPERTRPWEPTPPSLVAGREILERRGLELHERRVLDGALEDLAGCGDLTTSSDTVRLGVRVGPGGRVRDVLHEGGALASCVEAAVRWLRFPFGDDRTYSLSWKIYDSKVPTLRSRVTSGPRGHGTPARLAYNQAALQARRCLEKGEGTDGAVVLRGHWRTRADSQVLDATLRPQRSDTGLAGGALACIEEAFAGAELAEKASEAAMGVLQVTLSVPDPPSEVYDGPETKTGYELKVAAAVDGAPVGKTRHVFEVGSVPSLRVRASPPLAAPGDQVRIEMFRGPDFRGSLPEEVQLMQGSLEVAEVEVDEEDRSATFTIPEDRHGFFHVEVGRARAIVYAAPPDPLSLQLSTSQDVYRPGEAAQITVAATAGDAPSPALVSLAGVDARLGQLASLRGPDDWGRVTVRAQAESPAFDAFAPEALVLGRVQGPHAARAALLRIDELPMDPAGDAPFVTRDRSTHDDEEVLLTRFYGVLETLVAQVRDWEADAPETEVMTPERMVEAWEAALVTRRAEGEPATDAFGRPLTLALLPPDLLAQVDPRRVVSEGTRLPEDVVDWQRYVDEEVR